MINPNDDDLIMAAFKKEALLSRISIPEWMLDAMGKRKKEPKSEPRVKVTGLKQIPAQA